MVGTEMAENMGGESNGCTFIWEIENMSRCWLEKGERIESPAFIADALGGTKWCLWLFPMGVENENFISIYLLRDEGCSGPDVIEVNYQIACLGKDGLILKEQTIKSRSFKKPDNWGFSDFLTRKRVFEKEREAFLLEDSLTVQCTIWSNGETFIRPKHVYARTTFKVNRRFFMWKISRFSTRRSGLRKKLKDDLIDIDLVLTKGFDKLHIDVISFDKKIKCISCDVKVLNSHGKREYCGIKKYTYSTLKKGELSPNLLCPNVLMHNKDLYLQNDVLSLEFVFSTGEYFNYNGILNLTNELYFLTNVGKEKPPNSTPVLTDYLKSMYNDASFSDTEVRTYTKTFLAHKNILSARSPVFCRMFSNDMQEKTSGHVDIIDLEDDTVHRMFLYIYTDSLEDMQVERALKLYAAADKYDIPSLKSRCSSFMKENLCSTEVCSILVLADLHQDNDLKSFAENYILEHDQVVMGCQEWKDFMNTNLKLATDLMYRMLFPR